MSGRNETGGQLRLSVMFWGGITSAVFAVLSFAAGVIVGIVSMYVVDKRIHEAMGDTAIAIGFGGVIFFGFVAAALLLLWDAAS